MKTRITRDELVAQVAEALPYSAINDFPAIRTAANDIADLLRKDGCTVPDFAQDALVRAIQNAMGAAFRSNMRETAENGVRP